MDEPINEAVWCTAHDRLRVGWLDRSGRGSARAEFAQGTPTQSHSSPSILEYTKLTHTSDTGGGSSAAGDLRTTTSQKCAAVPRRARIEGS